MVANEAERLKALRQYRILDTKPEQAFDDLTLIASQICGVPIDLISLVDEDRQWFKSRVGVEAQETTRSVFDALHKLGGGAGVQPLSVDNKQLARQRAGELRRRRAFLLGAGPRHFPPAPCWRW